VRVADSHMVSIGKLCMSNAYHDTIFYSLSASWPGNTSDLNSKQLSILAMI
jgi:hypothetical protein